MGSGKAYTFRELVKKLKKHDNRFVVYKNQGKGSERMLSHPDINGREESYPLKCHGEGETIRRGHYSSIIRRFKLPSDFF